MTRIFFSSVALATIVAFHSAIQAAQVSLVAVKDNTIFADQPTSSNGIGDNFAAGKAGGASTLRHGLIAFDLTGLPAPIRVDRVALQLRYQGPTNQEQESRDLAIHRLLADWGEGTSNAGPGGTPGAGNGAPATTNDATWRRRFFDTQSWASYDPAVAGSGGGDFTAAPSASVTVGIDPGVLVTWETVRNGPATGMVADVEAWLANPMVNAGWLLKAVDETPVRTMRRFYSKDDANSAFHPRLVVDYTIIPEPATLVLVLLALSGLGVGRICRRVRVSVGTATLHVPHSGR